MSELTRSGKEVFEWIEIDQDFCNNSFGDAVPGYPLKDTGSVADAIEAGASSIATAAPFYTTGSITTSGVDETHIAAPTSGTLFSQSHKVTSTTKIACEFGVDSLPTGGVVVAFGIQECDQYGVVIPGRVWSQMILEFMGTGARTLERPGGTVYYDASFTSPTTKRVGIEVDMPAGLIRYYGTGETVRTTTFLPSVGNRLFAFIKIIDYAVAASGQSAQGTLYPSGKDMLLTYSAGSVDMNGVEISGQVAGACSAILTEGTEKCFNTISTCARPDNYDAGTLTLRFCKPNARLPMDGNTYIPFLSSVKNTPASINPGGADTNKSSIGTRAKLTATMTDHPYSDNYTDKYAAERIIGTARYDGAGYNPFERSTFWRKWAARNQWRFNRAVRHCSGYLDDNGQIQDQVTRHFIMTGFTGPSRSDQVTITGQDILTKIENRKAQCPPPSPGKLSASMTNSHTGTFTLATAGDEDSYATSGYLCIGDEVMSFTRSGATFDIGTRGLFGTTAQAHDAGDTVQECAHFDSLAFYEILEILLETYAGIPAGNLDVAGWTAESAAYLPRAYSALVPKPVGVFQLANELAEEVGFFMWFDERDNKVKVRAVRPADAEQVIDLNADANLIDEMTDIADQPEQQITRVVVNYGKRNVTGDHEDATNYRVADVFAADLVEGPDYHDGQRIKTIYSRWMTETDGAAASELGARILSAYMVPPRKVSFGLEAKDRAIWLGDFVNVSTARSVSETGLIEPVRAQILSVNETEPGAEYAYVGQQFIFDGPIDPSYRTIEIAADVNDIDLRALHDDKYTSAPTSGNTIVVTVRPGVVVGSTSTAMPAVATGSWPAGVNLSLVNNGTIAGRGGNGGNAPTSYASPDQTTAGTDGGTALEVTYALSVDNQGIIGGGGGGGGGFGVTVSGDPAAVASGGGGAGRIAGTAGVASKGSTNANVYQGADGSTLSGGAGYYGNNGGALGEYGLPLSDNPYTGGTDTFWKKGGAPGYAIDGYSNVTFITTGDIRGPTTG